MKIRFTLDAWLKDTSQKVVDEDDRPVRIICTDADGLYPIIGLVDNKIPLPCGKNGRPPYIGGGGGTLFLVTPEPELSGFEKAVGLEIFDEPFEEKHIKVIKEESAKLLSIARKELEPEVLERLEVAYKNQDEVVYENGKRDGKAEALKDLPRWIPNKFDKHNFETCKAYLDTPRYLCYQNKMIDVSELVEKLPGFKED